MVWIHGGAFLNGNPVFLTFGPHYLMENEVILVTVGYRLGSFGRYCESQFLQVLITVQLQDFCPPVIPLPLETMV